MTLAGSQKLRSQEDPAPVLEHCTEEINTPQGGKEEARERGREGRGAGSGNPTNHGRSEVEDVSEGVTAPAVITNARASKHVLVHEGDQIPGGGEGETRTESRGKGVMAREDPQ